jgi:signal transduction histidine kinase
VATEDGGSGQVAPSAIDLFVDALQAAVALVHADGGELATFDSARQAFVSRARMLHPHFDLAAGGARAGHMSPTGHTPFPPRPGAPAHPGASVPGASAPGARDAHHDTRRDSRPENAVDAVGIDTQSTVVLPAGASVRLYHPGEGLIGLVGQRGEPIAMRGDEYRERLQGTSGADVDAAWHLAVPIFRPRALSNVHGGDGVMGVLAVFIRNPQWSFSQREVELLALHADRIARSLLLDDLQQRNQLEVELLGTLRGPTGTPARLPEVYARVRDAVRQLIDAPSFALLRLASPGTEAVFEVAERDGKPLASTRVATHTLPAWWSAVKRGNSVCVSSAQDRAAFGQYTVAGWGGDQPVQSLLAAPLLRGAALFGVIVAASPRSDVYDVEQAQIFAAIARAASIVIENVLLTEDAQRSVAQVRNRNEQLAALNDAVLALVASLELDTTLQTLAEKALQLTPAEAALVLLLDENRTQLTGRAMTRRTPPHQPPGSHLPLDEIKLPLEWHDLSAVVQSEQFLLLDRLDSEWQEPAGVARFLAQEQITSCVLLPIVHTATSTGDQPTGTLGVLMVYTPGRHPFPPHRMSSDVGLLQSLARQAASAISNAMLFERQQELDRLKDEFILTISHEFRTPLTTIDGYVTLLNRHGAKLGPDKIEQFTNEIRQATSQLAAMIGMLADANRLSSEPLQMTLGPVNVHEAAARALSTQTEDARKRVKVEIAPQLRVFADGERLPLVFSNLLGNALKYAPQGPIEMTARVESREALVRQGRAHTASARAADRWVVMGVRDRGPGIAPEDMDKLFKKFVRLSRSLTTSVRGTGLGLWICREYLDAMGGDIWVESVYGQGSYFQFCLPIALTTGKTGPPSRG